MLNRTFLKQKLSAQTPYLSNKFKLDGKSYKISSKGLILNMRFNRSNKTILVLQNTSFLNKGGQKKVYCKNEFLLKNSLSQILISIRAINTYTLRGLWLSNKCVGKRSGRISEYM
jgi:hypothetical protein